MQQATVHRAAEFARLQTAYRAAWQRFSAAIRQRQWLQADTSADAAGIREAEALACFEEEQYRRARNELANYMLEHLSRKRSVALAQTSLQHLDSSIQPNVWP